MAHLGGRAKLVRGARPANFCGEPHAAILLFHTRRRRVRDGVWQCQCGRHRPAHRRTPLNTIVDETILDATTQSTYVGTPVVELAGSYFLNGLRAGYTFEAGSGSTITDFGSHVFTGTLSNSPAPSWSTGKTGGGLSFANDGDYVSLPNSILNGQSDLTTVFWLKTPTASADAVISAANASNDNELLVYMTSATSVDIYSSGSIRSFTTPNLADNAWHQLAIVRDDVNNTMTLYVDGVSIGTQSMPLSTLVVDTGGLILGQDQDSVGGSFESTQQFHGTLDNLRFYSRTMTAEQIESLYMTESGGLANGFTVNSGGTTIRGFAITDFTGDGIKLDTAGGNTIEGNIIGLRTSGTGSSANVVGGAVGWWRGELNGLDSAGSNHATLTNGVSFSTGIVGNAFEFDGTNDYAPIAAASTLQLNGSFTASAWINADSLTGDRTVFGMDSGGANNTLVLMSRNAKPYLAFFANDTQGNTTLQTGQWYHLVFRYDASNGEQAIFVNGSLDASSTGHSPLAGTTTVNLGRWAGTNYFDGKIDEAAIFNRSLSNSEISSLYNAGVAGKTPAITTQIAYFQADGNAQDSRGITTGTVVNGVTYSSGKVGSAFELDGSNDYVSISNAPRIQPSSSFSVGGWVRSDMASSNFQPIAIGESSTSWYSWSLRVNDQLKPQFALSNGGSWVAATDSSVLTQGEWTHIYATWDSLTNTARLYRNGVEVGSYTGAITTQANDQGIRLGWYETGNTYWDGGLDEIQINNHALTSAEVAELYASGMRGTDVGNNTGIEIVSSSSNDIGGLTTAERNIISGNTTNNILISGNGIPNDTISWWKADGNANDTLGSNQGTLTNGATISSNGKNGSAFSFDGINDYVSVDNESNFDFSNQQFTVDGWFQTSTTGTNQHLIAKGNTGQWQWGLRLEGDNKLAAIFWTSSGVNVVSTRSDNVLTDGEWHHFAAVFDTRTTSENILLYVDGDLQSSVTNSGASFDYGSGNANVYIGGRGDGAGSFNGLMDDVAIFGRALSFDEIHAIYRSGGGSKNSNFIQGNFIGTDITGTKDGGTSSFGIRISGSSGNLIGGTTSNAANTISGNDVYGIRIDSTSYGNLIAGNFIGTNATGTDPVSNGYGVMIEGGARNVVGVGLDGVGLKNVISGNITSGVHIYGLPAYDNVVAGNYIGTNAAGTASLGNSVGVYLQNTGSNLIGGDSAGEANLISGNGSSGVYITGNGAETGMVGWWRGDNSSADVFGFNNATLVNGATYAQGVTGTSNSAFSFNGSTQYATIADSPSLQLGKALSLSAWVNPNTLSGGTGYQTVVAKWDGSARNYGLYVKSDGSIELQYYNASNQQVIRYCDTRRPQCW